VHIEETLQHLSGNTPTGSSPYTSTNTRAERGNKDVADKEECGLINSAADSLYLDRPGAGNRVMLKIPVVDHYEDRTLDTPAILDDGSERTMLLPAAAKFLGVKGTPEALPLHTVRQDIQILHGHTVSFRVSPAPNPHTSRSMVPSQLAILA